MPSSSATPVTIARVTVARVLSTPGISAACAVGFIEARLDIQEKRLTLLVCLGETRERRHRAAAGNARPPDSEGGLARPAARLRRAPADPADLAATGCRFSRARCIRRSYRLEHQGLIAHEWGESENGRKAKYYHLTAAGRRRFKEETAYWQRLSDAIGLALKAVPEDV